MECKGTNASQGPKGPFSVFSECFHVVQRGLKKCAELLPVEFSLNSFDCLKFGCSSVSMPTSILFSKINKRSGQVIKSFHLRPLVSRLQSKTAAAVIQSRWLTLLLSQSNKNTDACYRQHCQPSAHCQRGHWFLAEFIVLCSIVLSFLTSSAHTRCCHLGCYF